VIACLEKYSEMTCPALRVLLSCTVSE
jgi:hypothetical protein